MRCIFFTEQPYTDRRFCRLCNQFLPKTLRFSLQRHKSSRIRLTPNSGMVCRFSLWNSAGCVRIWLGVFGKAGFFMCQSRSFRPTFWPPLQSVFAKETAFFSAKAQNCKKLRFLRLFAGFRLGVFYRIWNSAGCVRIWLEAFGKIGLFGSQSTPGPPYAVPSLFEIGILITEFSVS